MKKYIPIPITAIMDNDLTDAEKILLFKMIANFGTAIINPSEPTMKILGVSRRTFYRLIDNLMKCQYIQRLGNIPGYKISVSMLAQNSVINGTDCVKYGTDECQKWHSKREEESTKEEDKNNKQEYIYNNILKETENGDVESKTILTTPENNDKEKAKHSAGACAQEEPEKPKESERFTKEYREIIDYLNEKTGKRYSATSRVNQGHISARLKEGFTVEDFKHVIDVKCFQWKDDPKMAKFLRPETLFGTKFDRYLNEEKVVMRMGLHGETYTVSEDDMNSDVPF